MYLDTKYHKQLFDEPEVLRTIQGMLEFRIKILRELYDNETWVKFLEDGGYFRIYTDLLRAYEDVGVLLNVHLEDIDKLVKEKNKLENEGTPNE